MALFLVNFKLRECPDRLCIRQPPALEDLDLDYDANRLWKRLKDIRSLPCGNPITYACLDMSPKVCASRKQSITKGVPQINTDDHSPGVLDGHQVVEVILQVAHYATVATGILYRYMQPLMPSDRCNKGRERGQFPVALHNQA